MEQTDHNEVNISRPIRILHFSDGIEEEFDEKIVNKQNVKPIVNENVETVDPQSLEWVPWFKYYLWLSGTKVLNTVDYVGETLAEFFEITTPKYQLEISEYERMQEEAKKMEEESAGWVSNNMEGEVPLVLIAPNSSNNPTNVQSEN